MVQTSLLQTTSKYLGLLDYHQAVAFVDRQHGASAGLMPKASPWAFTEFQRGGVTEPYFTSAFRKAGTMARFLLGTTAFSITLMRGIRFNLEKTVTQQTAATADKSATVKTLEPLPPLGSRTGRFHSKGIKRRNASVAKLVIDGVEHDVVSGDVRLSGVKPLERPAHGSHTGRFTGTLKMTEESGQAFHDLSKLARESIDIQLVGIIRSYPEARIYQDEVFLTPGEMHQGLPLLREIRSDLAAKADLLEVEFGKPASPPAERKVGIPELVMGYQGSTTHTHDVGIEPPSHNLPREPASDEMSEDEAKVYEACGLESTGPTGAQPLSETARDRKNRLARERRAAKRLEV